MMIDRTYLLAGATALAMGMACAAPLLAQAGSPVPSPPAHRPDRRRPVARPAARPGRDVDAEEDALRRLMTRPTGSWWKLADVLAMHKGARRLVAADHPQQRSRRGLAPAGGGRRTPELAYPDNRTVDHRLERRSCASLSPASRPFVAGKGFEIDVPLRVPFTLETVGDEPALWFEIHAASDLPLYPVATTPSGRRTLPAFVTTVA